MKYTLKQLDEQTARIAFESRLPYNSKNRPVIATLCSHACKDGFLAHGLAIGLEEDLHNALIIHVKRRDLVVIKEMARGRRSFSWKFFRIDKNFRPQLLDLPDREPATGNEWMNLLEVQGRTDSNPKLDDDRLRNFMADTHPDWLGHIVARQIDLWRAKTPAALLKFAPWSLTEEEIAFWIRQSPAMVLEYIKLRLSAIQLESCILACPEVAIQFAFECLTTSQLADAVINHPSVILEHAAGKIPHDMLRLCAAAAPSSAFFARGKMPPVEQAILLARGYAFSWQAQFGFPDPDMHEELLTSLENHSSEWLASHNNSCASIFEQLFHHHKLVIPPESLLRLIEVMPANQHEFLVKALASNV